ncbi:YkvI family membrane protein [Fictibacillus sp. NRS-1165]|uniref:YkvI family membrane protein n=1 Tax=Fictibacillus sp. NRS-1165 TaxID=3144463 RepID=UPI003D21312F
MGIRRKQIIQIAATYIGTVVGAGFATGREIVEFFTVHGSAGFLGILISGFLFIYLGTKIMLLARTIGADTYEALNRYLFGDRIATGINLIMFIMLFGVTSVMLSGTGALFSEQLHLPFHAGIILTVILCFIVMQKGMDGILWTNSVIVPVMILFSIIISVSMFFSPIEAPLIRTEDFTRHWKWLFSPFTYAAFNLTLSQAVLVPLSREAEDETVIKWGGFIGGLGLTFILLNSHFALYLVPQSIHHEIPVAEIISKLGAIVHFLFLIVVYGEIFTTLIGNLFGLLEPAKQYIKLSSNVILCLLMGGGYLISLFGYSSLLHYLYPLFGLIGLLYLGITAFKKGI